MPVSEKEGKVLWGRSGGRCAICKILLSSEPGLLSTPFSIGEQAHIVAEDPKGPRGDSPLSIEERNSCNNLILLCPTHHRIIDKDTVSYSVERLHEIKARHENWVDARLSQAEAWVASWFLTLLRTSFNGLKGAMTVRHGRDPKWLSCAGYASTLYLGAYCAILSFLYTMQILVYILFARGGDVTIAKQFLAAALLILLVLGGRIGSATARNSWWHLKQLFWR